MQERTFFLYQIIRIFFLVKSVIFTEHSVYSLFKVLVFQESSLSSFLKSEPPPLVWHLWSLDWSWESHIYSHIWEAEHRVIGYFLPFLKFSSKKSVSGSFYFQTPYSNVLPKEFRIMEGFEIYLPIGGCVPSLASLLWKPFNHCRVHLAVLMHSREYNWIWKWQ